jgi:hypothetical protein
MHVKGWLSDIDRYAQGNIKVGPAWRPLHNGALNSLAGAEDARWQQERPAQSRSDPEGSQGDFCDTSPVHASALTCLLVAA